MMIKVQVYRDDGTVLVENLHQIHFPGKYGWALHPADSHIIDGSYAYSGYTLELHGRENKQKELDDK